MSGNIRQESLVPLTDDQVEVLYEKLRKRLYQDVGESALKLIFKSVLYVVWTVLLAGLVALGFYNHK
jgi:hypothetical protein